MFILSGTIENTRQEGAAPYYAFGDDTDVPINLQFVAGD